MTNRPRIVSGCLSAAFFMALTGCGGDPGPAPAALPELAPPAEGQGFQIDEGTFSVEGGREALYCKRFPIPASYGEGPLYVRGVESRLPTGTHHFFMSYGEEPLSAPKACVGDAPLLNVDDPAVEEQSHGAVDGKLAFTAAVGEVAYQLPDGYGLYLKSGAGHFTTSHHLLNFASEPRQMYGLFNVLTAAEEDVHHPVNVLNCVLRDIAVPPHAEAALTATCTVPFDLEMVILSSHAHQLLRRFEMRVFDGEKTLPDIIYESEQWDSPAIVPLATPLPLKQGQGLTFTCYYENPSGEEIGFGAGEHAEMCATMSAFAYPKDRPGELPPSLAGVAFTEGEVTGLVDSTEIGGNF